jgi:hypothetical protein
MLICAESAKTLTLQYHAMWKVDVNTGVISYPTTKKRYATRDAQISRRGRSNTASSPYKSKFRPISDVILELMPSSNSTSVGPGEEIAFNNVTGTGARQWLSLHYTVNDPQGTSWLRCRRAEICIED